MSSSIVYRCTETGEIIVEDNRIFSEVIDLQIQGFKKSCEQDILAICPEFKQRNAALGILSPEETDSIISTIQNLRNKCHQLEQQVLAITWDGREETRAAACDAIQQLSW